MNMLQVQDTLKGASDDQLMREMMNPSGMAPQFLVLSEMKRRKDMRSKATPPQGTVAEDLMAEGNQARQAMTVSEDEPEYADEEMMARGGLAALRRYAEGGVVRMQAGGRARLLDGYSRQELFEFVARGQAPAGYTMADVQSAMGRPGGPSIAGPGAAYTLPGPGDRGRAEPPLSPVRPMFGGPPSSPGRDPNSVAPNYYNPQETPPRDIQSLSKEEINSYLRGYNLRNFDTVLAPSLGGMLRNRSAQSSPYSQSDLRLEQARRLPATPREEFDPRLEYDFNPETGESYPRPSVQTLNSAPGAPAQRQAVPLTPTTPSRDGPDVGNPNASRVDDGRLIDLMRAALPVRLEDPLAPRRAAPPVARPAPARGRDLSPAATGLPALTQELAQAGAPPPDRLDPLLERMREGRTDAGSRRSDAMNMALIEAGLRIAGSNSPRLAGAISEGGIPALQGFTQQTQQIRQDQRQDLRDELQTAVAGNTNDYRRGSLNEQRYATDMSERLAREANQSRERAAGIAAGSRYSEGDFMRDYIEADPAKRALMLEARGRNNSERSENDREQRLAMALQRDPEIASLAARLAALSGLPGDAAERQRVALTSSLNAARARVVQQQTSSGSGQPARNYNPATGNFN